MVMTSTELVLNGKWHKSHCAVSIDKPGEVLNEDIEHCKHCLCRNLKRDHINMRFLEIACERCLQAYLPPSCFLFTMWLVLLTVRLMAMSLLSPARKNELDHSITP